MDEFNTIFLDFDGTIHDVVDSYYKILKNICISSKLPKIITKKEAEKYLGYNPVKMWEEFMPNLPIERRKELIKEIGLRLEKDILRGETNLYKGSEKILEELKSKDKTIIIISNCTNNYKNNAIKRFNLDKYIKRFYTAEEFNYISKEEILDSIIDEYHEDYIFVGDRIHDIKAANYNNIKSIFCNYGYGKIEEGNNANYRINNIKEILKIV